MDEMVVAVTCAPDDTDPLGTAAVLAAMDAELDRAAVGLAQRLTGLARELQAKPDLEQTLLGVIDAALTNVRGARHASITLVAGRKFTTPAGSDDLVRLLDRAKHETGQGPCLDAIRARTTVRVDDLRDETRWPDFTRRALALGVRSMLSFQLYVQDKDLGALNLYSEDPYAFDEDSEHIGMLLAGHAAIALIDAQQLEHLRAALHNRDVIGQAKGVLMERYKINADRAFDLLVRASRDTNRKLHDVAREITETGVDPNSV
jgi:GAF domain-containing protein